MNEASTLLQIFGDCSLQSFRCDAIAMGILWKQILALWLLQRSATACHLCHSLLVPPIAFTPANRKGGLSLTVWTRWVDQQPAAVLGMALVHRAISNRILHSQQDETGEDDAEKPSSKDAVERNSPALGPGPAMVASIGFYKKFISPLLPPACRFLPTCSRYGVQAIEQFGPGKGSVLIAWRLLRCSPIGGRGYDPPKWPPVAFTYSSY